MGLYEREYGTDWTTLDKDEATERAYALGVAESLGEGRPLRAVRPFVQFHAMPRLSGRP